MKFGEAFRNPLCRDLPGGPVVKTLHSQCWGPCSIPGQETRFHMPQLKISSAATKDPACWNEEDQRFHVLQLRLGTAKHNFFNLEDNCFTILCMFLLYSNVIQLLSIGISPPSEASLPTSNPTPLGCHGALGWAPCVTQQLPTSDLFYT